MHVSPDGTFVRDDIWREGKWIDLWSVVHFLSGMSIGFGLYVLGFGFFASSVISLLLLVAWELWEALEKLAETLQNRFADIVIGMASFAFTFLWLAPRLQGTGLYATFAGIFAANCISAAFGWTTSRKAYLLEQKLRAKYRRERAKLSSHVSPQGILRKDR